jgi:uncharacterized glyoxalase superfamily protein PhnB
MSLDQAAIVAPSMRFVPVSDRRQSIHFYCDVLGFQEQQISDDYGAGAAAELSYGAARLQLCLIAENSSLEPVILFFQTDGVGKLRETVIERGGKASALQKVNWIKMEMFEVRDPDGNVVWFGESFQQPTPAQPPPMLQEMLPHFPVDQVEPAVTYYCDVLGFRINYAQHDLGVMYRDNVTLLLIERPETHKGIGSCTVYIENADQLYQELASKGAKTLAPPVSRPWGLRDFTIVDLDGNRITFAQPFE